MHLACVLKPSGTDREATGLDIKTKYIMLFAAIINLVLSIILGKVMGLNGILLASAIARLTTYFWYEPLLLFKEYFSQPVCKYYIPILGNAMVMLMSIMIFNSIFKTFIVVSWPMLFIKAGICVLATCMIFLILYLKTEGMKLILRKIGIKKLILNKDLI